MIAYIDEYKHHFPVELICRTLHETPAGFLTSRGYRAAKTRPRSARSIKDEILGEELVKLFHQNYSCLGVEKMQVIMRKAGWVIGRDQLRRLMRINNISGTARGKQKKTTIASEILTPSDKVNRQFGAIKPHQLWVADMTYVRTRSGFAYTAFVIDAFNREILGWNTASVMPTELPLEALNQAISATRSQLNDLVHHSDKGSQYTSIAYTNRLIDLGITPSTGTTGDAYDNALAESVNAAYKTELIKAHGPWKTIMDVELATMNWVHWWNNHRPHASLNYMTPHEFTTCHQQNVKTTEQPTPAPGKP